MAKNAGLTKTLVYVSVETLEDYGTSEGVNCYEVAAPDPVKGFLAKKMCIRDRFYTILTKKHWRKIMKNTIITVVGKDTVGIIARVCTYLAENQINIEDISQTIVQGYFNMMMIVDTSASEKHFGTIAEDQMCIRDRELNIIL